MKSVGMPDALVGHVRFDEEGPGRAHSSTLQIKQPAMSGMYQSSHCGRTCEAGAIAKLPRGQTHRPRGVRPREIDTGELLSVHDTRTAMCRSRVGLRRASC